MGQRVDKDLTHFFREGIENKESDFFIFSEEIFEEWKEIKKPSLEDDKQTRVFNMLYDIVNNKFRSKVGNKQMVMDILTNETAFSKWKEKKKGKSLRDVPQKDITLESITQSGSSNFTYFKVVSSNLRLVADLIDSTERAPSDTRRQLKINIEALKELLNRW